MPTAFESWSQLAPQAAGLTADERFNVFVSYGSVRTRLVDQPVRCTSQPPHTLFLDHRDLRQDERSAALTQSQVGLIVWSAAAADADWMHRTFVLMTQHAAARAFPVVIARIGESHHPDFVSTSTVVDFPLYKAGAGGGEALRLLWPLSGQTPAQDAQRFAAEQDTAARDFV